MGSAQMDNTHEKRSKQEGDKRTKKEGYLEDILGVHNFPISP